MAKKASPSGNVLQLKITLEHSKPPIWRRVEVLDTFTLKHLHDIIQTVMPWESSHLHSFKVNNSYYSVKYKDMFDDMDDMEDAAKVKLKAAFQKEKAAIHYEYDFGDSWNHKIVLEKIMEPEPNVHYPRCTAGKLACPPEDCGGIWGYYELLEAIKDPNHPEHEDMLDWVGGEWDAEEFDIDTINQDLSQLKLS